ncbi:MAG TPA: tetratricopeptide repeat protein [Tepidisphaeraceae bacterium]|nr:tetratricopeptide repeat protein [Tepidisphaeraceae bacterium]
MTGDELLQLALQHHRAGDLSKAEIFYREALATHPANADAAWSNLGTALSDQGRYDQAISAYEQGLTINPNQPQIHNNLGAALRHARRREEAIQSFRRAIELRADYPEAWNNLGSALRESGKLDDAIAALRRAIHLRPDYAEALSTLGCTLDAIGRYQEAVAFCGRAAAISPSLIGVHCNFGNALKDVGRLDDAVREFRREIGNHPEYADGYLALGNALKDQGRLDEAISQFRSAIELGAAAAADNVLFVIHYHPDYGPERIYDEHVKWREKFMSAAAPVIDHPNDRESERRLRIGYISPDLRGHPVGRFMLPLLTHHDHRRFEIFCYSDALAPDAVTAELRRHSNAWRDTIGVTEEQLFDQIRQDGIDILVDLAMHSAGNRLGVFARKPAPVQATYLAYCSTTGLETIDYRMTDPYFDPPDANDDVYSERSIRLPRTYWCYSRPADAPDVQPPPALRSRSVTFGCLNNFCKITPPVWETWCRLLREVPDSRLIVFSAEGEHRQDARQRLARDGIDPNRLQFVARLSVQNYFEQYHQIDIALDPFPFCGGTTTCDALWMGVPVVSLAGATAVSRAGFSILSNVGLPELVARTPDQYIAIAADLARDLDRLAHLRSTLRERMIASSLMDAPAFARDVEAAFRQMWQTWTRSAKPNPA